MLRYIALRAIQAALTLLGVLLLTFLLVRLAPGDAVDVRGGERGRDPVHAAAMRAELGLDQPLAVQFVRYVGRLASGDFGTSYTSHQTVLQEFGARFPATVELTFFAILWACLLGVPAGIVAAMRRGSWWDYGVIGVSLIGYSMPIFWWAVLLVLFFSLELGLTPVTGRIDIAFFLEPVTGFMTVDAVLAGDKAALISALRHLILPAVVLGTLPLAVVARMTRSCMLDILREDYIRTARAKGLGPWRVIGGHALGNAALPLVTVVGLQIGQMMGGAILTETIFAWPGVGKWLIDAIGRRDYPVIQGSVLLIAMVIILLNLSVDAIYGLLNPMIRHGRDA